MQAKWWIQFSIQAVLFLIGTGGIFVPQIDTWLYTAIIWGVAFAWAIITLILWMRSRKNISVDKADKDDYARKIIIDSKALELLETTTILKNMANRVSEVMANSTVRKIKLPLLNLVQQEIRQNLDMKADNQFFERSRKEREQLVIQEMKKAKLYTEKYNEKFVHIFLTIEWAQEKHKMGLSHQLIKPTESYYQLNLKLTPRISSTSALDAVKVYKDVCLGLNSLILYQNRFPQEYKILLPELDMPFTQWIHDRDELLDSLLGYTSKKIEEELNAK